MQRRCPFALTIVNPAQEVLGRGQFTYCAGPPRNFQDGLTHLLGLVKMPLEKVRPRQVDQATSHLRLCLVINRLA